MKFGAFVRIKCPDCGKYVFDQFIPEHNEIIYVRFKCKGCKKLKIIPIGNKLKPQN